MLYGVASLILLMVYSALLAMIGFLPARFFLKDNPHFSSKEILNASIALSSFILGALVFNLSLYFISTTFHVGISHVAIPVLVTELIAVGLIFYFQKREFACFTQYLKETSNYFKWILFICLPLSYFHIVLPMMEYDWLMAYSIGNDGSRYLLMIDYLQDACWQWGVSARDYPMANRPLMHYFMAAPKAIFPINTYLAYSVSSGFTSFLTAISIATISIAIFRRGIIVALIVAGAGVGCFGFLQAQYYAGFLGQYFSIFSVIFFFLIFFLNQNRYKQGVWLAFLMLCITLMYSIGLAIMSGFIGLIVLVFRLINREITSRIFLSNILLLAAALGLVVVGYNTELGKAGSFLAARNQGYDYGFFNSILILSGLASKYSDYKAWTNLKLVSTLSPLIIIFLFAVFQAIRNSKSDSRFLGMLVGYVFVITYLYTGGQYYLLNKIAVFAVPLLLLCGASFAKLDATDKKWRVLVARMGGVLALSALALNGAATTIYFYGAMAYQRQTYISQEMLDIRNELYAQLGRPPVVFSVDSGLERNLLIRQLFSESEFQPERDASVWPEHRLSVNSYPASFDKYKYDIILAANDYFGPLEYGNANKNSKISNLGPHLDIFGEGASAVDFDFNWESGTWLPADENKRTYKRSMQLKTGSGSFVLASRGAKGVLFRIKTKQSNEVEMTINGSKRVPIPSMNGTDERVMSIDCLSSCREGANQIEISQSDNFLEVINIGFGA